MSDISSPIPEGAFQSGSPPLASPPARRRPRLWPGVAIVALMWGAILGVQLIDPEKVEAVNQMVQFQVRFMAPTVAGALFLVWWLFFSRLRWLDRLLVP